MGMGETSLGLVQPPMPVPVNLIIKAYPIASSKVDKDIRVVPVLRNLVEVLIAVGRIG